MKKDDLVSVIVTTHNRCTLMKRAVESIQKQSYTDLEIIIIDDALGNLDASVRIQLLNLTLDLQQRLDISYIYVGQDLGVIKHIADTVIVMDKGKMIKSGTPKTLFTDPQTDVTGRLVESYFGKILDETAWVKDKNTP